MGSLIYEEFVRDAAELVATSETLGDGWELRHVRATDGPEQTAFLAKRSCVVMETAPCAEGEGDPDSSREPENIEDADPAQLDWGREPETACFEYHVIYSESYQVPVLFFTATFHSGKLVPLREIWRAVSPFHVTRESGMEWESVTQREHPILCRPFYHLHPCHTSSVMATVLGTYKQANYLLSWLTTFGPTVGLNLSLDYLKIK